VPGERLLEVARHYQRFGGVSPINAQNRALAAAIERELEVAGIHLPIYLGNRHWHPLVGEAVARMAADGVRRALAFVTSAYSSYPGCRAYLEDVARARDEVGGSAPRIEKLRAFWNHPGFIAPMVENVRRALERVPLERRNEARLVFTGHSIPTALAATCDYVAQLRDAAELVSQWVAPRVPYDLVFQSRSGPPARPWLEPDVGDHLEALARQGVRDAVVVPIGFISDHMEVVYDLDTLAQERAAAAGIGMVRAATVGTAPDFVAMIRELVVERIEPDAPRRSLGALGIRPDRCPPDCCRPPVGRPEGPGG
jgi:ferrochelatase